MKTLPFENDCILLSGGSQGIGRAMVIEFVRKGGRVLHGDTDELGAKELKEELGKDADRTIFVPVDFRRVDAWQQLLAARPADWNPTILIANVGMGLGASLKDVTLEDYERLMQINLRSTFLGMQAALPWFEKAGRGSAIFVGSVLTETIFLNRSIYTATKAGLLGLMRSLAVELAPKKIRVNMVLPGYARTNPPGHFREKIPPEHWAEFSRHFDSHISNIFERLQPLPLEVNAQDIARATTFLCSEEARCITGVDILIDGGLSLRYTPPDGIIEELGAWTPEMKKWLAEKVEKE